MDDPSQKYAGQVYCLSAGAPGHGIPTSGGSQYRWDCPADLGMFRTSSAISPETNQISQQTMMT